MVGIYGLNFDNSIWGGEFNNMALILVCAWPIYAWTCLIYYHVVEEKCGKCIISIQFVVSLLPKKKKKMLFPTTPDCASEWIMRHFAEMLKLIATWVLPNTSSGIN